jgi:glycosyltransferase involved in cell wall biosynthesis
MLGLSAAKVLGIKKRIYTRHHSTFHHQYHPQAVKYDKICNDLATDIVAISENVQNVLIDKEHVQPEKIYLIHHGFDLEKFQSISQKKIDDLKKKYGIIKQDYPVIGVISRYINWKGHSYIINAFKQVKEKYPSAKLVLANATGPDKDAIQSLLKKNLPKNSYIEIPFEHDLFTLYQLFDIYVHIPINESIEAFGQTYVEALAAGIPSVFTLSGVAKEFIKHGENALVVPFKNSEETANNIIKLLENKPLAKKLFENGKKSIKQFSLENFIFKLEKLYQ